MGYFASGSQDQLISANTHKDHWQQGLPLESGERSGVGDSPQPGQILLMLLSALQAWGLGAELPVPIPRARV